MAEVQVGYRQLMRTNRNVRRLWAGTVVSLFGDWFNTLALYRLALELTGSELALGGVLLTKLLPLALAAPVAAALVDRLDRKHVMIGADLLRAGIVLGFLFVREAGDLSAGVFDVIGRAVRAVLGDLEPRSIEHRQAVVERFVAAADSAPDRKPTRCEVCRRGVDVDVADLLPKTYEARPPSGQQLA